ncbi:MAG: cupin domain-containing protein [Nitrosopumilus sp. H8]|nr:MAG: cupin domain-containing protein [Nitrosopumilus sp. H13]RNJ78306.1 MAG: cupin domain-containing protein [Nitrosopumilus sp. H8]
MEKTSIYGKGQQRRVNPDWFTGRTWMKVLSEKIGSKKQDMYHVHFERRSRTKLHKHDGDQILIGTRGRGSLEIFKRSGSSRTRFGIKRAQRIAINDGDVVHIPAGTLHTHGATGPGTFSHIAINVLAGRGRQYKTAWYESDCKSAVTGTI